MTRITRTRSITSFAGPHGVAIGIHVSEIIEISTPSPPSAPIRETTGEALPLRPVAPSLPANVVPLRLRAAGARS